jgi:hypothetical protein
LWRKDLGDWELGKVETLRRGKELRKPEGKSGRPGWSAEFKS